MIFLYIVKQSSSGAQKRSSGRIQYDEPNGQPKETPPKKSRKGTQATGVNGDISSSSSTTSQSKSEPLVDKFCDPANPIKVLFQDVSAAAYKIKNGVMKTPCTVSFTSNIYNIDLKHFVKLCISLSNIR